MSQSRPALISCLFFYYNYSESFVHYFCNRFLCCLILVWQCQRNQRQCDSGPKCLDGHFLGLLPHVSKLGFIFNLLCFACQIARTARSLTHSGLVSPLKKT